MNGQHRSGRAVAWPALAAGATLLVLAGAPGARADDLADEAELHFQIGAERYRARDFRGALEHFFASNRLVPNRVVVFDIARTYEQIRQHADAYRYYTQALEMTPDAAARAGIEAAQARLAGSVAVLHVATEPPGATIYVDRRDLGPRGKSPRTLAFPAGRYRILVEREGYVPAEAGPLDLAIGRRQDVRLVLVPRTGTVAVRGSPAGAEARAGRDASAPACRIPCELRLPPGRQALYLSATGSEPAVEMVDVQMGKTVVVTANLSSQKSAVLVDCDEPGAEVVVDGRAAGRTPAIVELTVGRHDVRVHKDGFESVSETIDVRPGSQRIDVALVARTEVVAASRAVESVASAPGSVSVVTGEELRAMGYPTLVEALRGVRGIYGWDDRTYAALGFRGLGRPGDYGNRVLVMADGHTLNDNIAGSSYVGYDGRVDLDDVERIEVVRGPGSVLYGTGALSGVINLVPRRARPGSGIELGVSAAGEGVARVRVRGEADLGAGRGVIASFSGARSGGVDVYSPVHADPAAGSDGVARGLDGFRAGTSTGRAWWGSLSAQWYVGTRSKDIATGEYGTTFGAPGTRVIDTRTVAELRHEGRLGPVRLHTRAFVDHYRFRGWFVYDQTQGGTLRETYDGLWGGGEARAIVPIGRTLDVTLGGEGQKHVRADLGGGTESDTTLDERHHFALGAGYLLADLKPWPALRVSAGARLDAASTFGSALSPRLVVVARPYARGVVKLMAGRAFRAPTIYELYYNDGGLTQLASPGLGPETASSGEIEFTHHLTADWTALGAVYAHLAEGLIVARGMGTEQDPASYVNSGQAILGAGVEAELRREWRRGTMFALSYAFQRSKYRGDPISAGRRTPNSPEHLAAARVAVPLLPRALVAMTRIGFEGPRFDAYDRDDDPEQGRVDALFWWDVVLSGEIDRRGIRYAAGLHNAFDSRADLPVSREFRQRTIRQSGRTLLLSVSVGSR